MWRTPSTTCAAAYGGTRTSTDLPGARCASRARKCLVSSRRSAPVRSSRAIASATAAGSWGWRRGALRHAIRRHRRVAELTRPQHWKLAKTPSLDCEFLARICCSDRVFRMIFRPARVNVASLNTWAPSTGLVRAWVKAS